MDFNPSISRIGGPFDDFIIGISEHFGELVEEFGDCAGYYGGGGKCCRCSIVVWIDGAAVIVVEQSYGRGGVDGGGYCGNA